MFFVGEVEKHMSETNFLKEQARQCRANARSANSVADRRGLMQMATYYDREAARLSRESAASASPALVRQNRGY